MIIRTVLVNIDLNADVPLTYATSLAQAFDAALLGVAADQPPLLYAGVDAYQTSADYYSVVREEIEKRLVAAEARFRSSVPSGMKSQWRSVVGSTSDAIVDGALRADLIVTAQKDQGALGEARDVDIGHIMLSSGRPVLVVADPGAAFKCDRIVIGWKDTREARRALTDALPFLARASEVKVLTISEGEADAEREKLDEVLAWLDTHQVNASSELIESDVGYIDVLESTARAYQADLVVTGGYGHSRMRELLFGGMTRNLIAATTINRLFSN